MKLDAARPNILKEASLPRRGSLAAWRRSLRARCVDQTEFVALHGRMGSVLPHAAEV